MTLDHKAYKSALLALAVSSLAMVVFAQERSSQKGGGDESDKAPENTTVIKRRPLILEDPRTFRIPLQLEPARSIALTAPVDGIVRSVHVKIGESLPAQGDVVRMDETRSALLERRAKALLVARQIDRKLAEHKLAAGGGSADEVARADAHLEAAKAELDLAQHDRGKMVIRGPFEGTIIKLNVVPGQFVRAGEPVAQLADLTSLTAKIPVDRRNVKPGGRIDVKIETRAVNATVEAVLPPPARFDPLRELADSLSMAVIRIPNNNNEYQPGQAVHVGLIPEKSVAVVPSISVSNQDEGRRKVQVVRDFTVRDITVAPLAQIGSERIYVSGEFSPGDEVIVSSTVELSDGTLLRPWSKEIDDPDYVKSKAKKGDSRQRSNKGP